MKGGHYIMASRKLTEKLIHQSQILEEMRLIVGSETDYITPSGRIYKDYGNNFFFPKKNFIKTWKRFVY